MINRWRRFAVGARNVPFATGVKAFSRATRGAAAKYISSPEDVGSMGPQSRR